MLKKGLKLFGFGHQNQYRVSQMKSWPEILSRVGKFYSKLSLSTNSKDSF